MTDQFRAEDIQEKLHRAIKAKAVLAERSKQLAQQVDDARVREDQTNHLMSELIERQRELNFMLHRANSVLQRMQEANAALSTEFTELVKELPQPDAPDWEQRVTKINDLFKKTGAMAEEVEDEIFRKGLEPDHIKPMTPPPAEKTVQDVSPSDIPEPEPVVALATEEPLTEQLEPSKQIADEDHDAIIEAEVVELVPAQPEEPQEPEVPELEPMIEADIYVQEQKDREEKLDRLFRALDTEDDGTPDTDNESDGSSASEGNGVLTRVWKKLKNRRQTDAQPTTEGTDAQDHSADDAGRSQQSEETVKPKAPPVSDLWDEATELDLIRMDIIPPKTDTIPVTIPGIRPISWLKPRHGKNLNRRIRPPEAHGHA